MPARVGHSNADPKLIAVSFQVYMYHCDPDKLIVRDASSVRPTIALKTAHYNSTAMNVSKSRLLALIVMSLATVDGLKLWTRNPANPNNIQMSAYVIGNGKQGGSWSLIMNC